MAENDSGMMETMLKKAAKQADQAEIYKSMQRQILLKSVLDRIESCESSFSEGYAVRVIKKGRLGFSFFSSPDEFPRALKSALHSSRFSPKTDIEFPKKQRYKKVKGRYELRLTPESEQNASKDLLAMVDTIAERKVTPVQCFVNLDEAHAVLINSEGGVFRKQDSLMNASAIAQFKESRQYDFRVSRKHFDAKEVAGSAAFLARKFAGAKPVRGEFDIILHPKAVLSLFEEILLPSLDGKRAFRGKSYFSGKLGQQVAAPGISIIDKPLLDNGVASAACDSEAVPCKNKAIIDRGVLSSFIFDLESAAIAGEKTTGNGFRGDFTSSPGIGNANIIVECEPGADEMNGIVIHELIAVHNANALTGDFAIQIGSGAIVKHGEIKKSVRACSIVGNFFEILQQAEPVGEIQNYSWLYSPALQYHGKIV